MSLQTAFEDLVDLRIERNERHSLIDLIILTICALYLWRQYLDRR